MGRIISARDSIWVTSEFYDNDYDWWRDSGDIREHPDLDEAQRRGWIVTRFPPRLYSPDSSVTETEHEGNILVRPQGDKLESLTASPLYKDNVKSEFPVWTHSSHGEGSVYMKPYATLFAAIEGADQPPGRDFKIPEDEPFYHGDRRGPTRANMIREFNDWIQREHRPYE